MSASGEAGTKDPAWDRRMCRAQPGGFLVFVGLPARGNVARVDVSQAPMRPDELERRLRKSLETLGPMGRQTLQTVLVMTDSEQRADVIGKMWNFGSHNRAFAELLIDCEE